MNISEERVSAIMQEHNCDRAQAINYATNEDSLAFDKGFEQAARLNYPVEVSKEHPIDVTHVQGSPWDFAGKGTIEIDGKSVQWTRTLVDASGGYLVSIPEVGCYSVTRLKGLSFQRRRDRNAIQRAIFEALQDAYEART